MKVLGVARGSYVIGTFENPGSPSTVLESPGDPVEFHGDLGNLTILRNS